MRHIRRYIRFTYLLTCLLHV